MDENEIKNSGLNPDDDDFWLKMILGIIFYKALKNGGYEDDYDPSKRGLQENGKIS